MLNLLLTNADCQASMVRRSGMPASDMPGCANMQPVSMPVNQLPGTPVGVRLPQEVVLVPCVTYQPVMCDVRPVPVAYTPGLQEAWAHEGFSRVIHREIVNEQYCEWVTNGEQQYRIVTFTQDECCEVSFYDIQGRQWHVYVTPLSYMTHVVMTGAGVGLKREWDSLMASGRPFYLIHCPPEGNLPEDVFCVEPREWEQHKNAFLCAIGRTNVSRVTSTFFFSPDGTFVCVPDGYVIHPPVSAAVPHIREVLASDSDTASAMSDQSYNPTEQERVALQDVIEHMGGRPVDVAPTATDASTPTQSSDSRTSPSVLEPEATTDDQEQPRPSLSLSSGTRHTHQESAVDTSADAAVATTSETDTESVVELDVTDETQSYAEVVRQVMPTPVTNTTVWPSRTRPTLFLRSEDTNRTHRPRAGHPKRHDCRPPQQSQHVPVRGHQAFGVERVVVTHAQQQHYQAPRIITTADPNHLAPAPVLNDCDPAESVAAAIAAAQAQQSATARRREKPVQLSQEPLSADELQKRKNIQTERDAFKKLLDVPDSKTMKEFLAKVPSTYELRPVLALFVEIGECNGQCNGFCQKKIKAIHQWLPRKDADEQAVIFLALVAQLYRKHQCTFESESLAVAGKRQLRKPTVTDPGVERLIKTVDSPLDKLMCDDTSRIKKYKTAEEWEDQLYNLEMQFDLRPYLHTQEAVKKITSHIEALIDASCIERKLKDILASFARIIFWEPLIATCKDRGKRFEMMKEYMEALIRIDQDTHYQQKNFFFKTLLTLFSRKPELVDASFTEDMDGAIYHAVGKVLSNAQTDSKAKTARSYMIGARKACKSATVTRFCANAIKGTLSVVHTVSGGVMSVVGWLSKNNS